MIACSFTVSHYRLALSFLHCYPDSGHGGQTRDLDGDEIDGLDEGKVLTEHDVSRSN